MNAVEFSYRELSETPHIEAVPLAHLSIQVGQARTADLLGLDGSDRRAEELIDRRFGQVAPWLQAAVKGVRDRFGDRARVSTCFLLDDYFLPDAAPEPAPAVAALTAAAHRAGFRLDYLARTGGCDIARERPHAGPRERHPVADIVAGSIVQEAEVGANGSRPPTAHTGWLANGRRSPVFRPAMDDATWVPPEVFGPDTHSVFVDVELWSRDPDPDGRSRADGESEAPEQGGEERGQDGDSGGDSLLPAPWSVIGRRRYSAALLAAVWHLLRLGLLRDTGAAVAVPYRFAAGEAVPRRWAELPSITQLTADAAPFAAYQTLSMLPSGQRGVEHAAGIILDHVQLDDRVLKQLTDRAGAERPPFRPPLTPGGRISHLFLDDVYAALDD